MIDLIVGYSENVDRWYLVSEAMDFTKYFDTAEEAWNMSDKITFVNSLTDLATELAKVSDIVPDMAQVYFDREYNSGGANEIVDTDLEEIGMTAADVSEIITLLNNYEKFTEGDVSLVDAVYRITMNKFRDDT